MNSVLVEFKDGYRVVTSRYAVRRIKEARLPLRGVTPSKAAGPWREGKQSSGIASRTRSAAYETARGTGLNPATLLPKERQEIV